VYIILVFLLLRVPVIGRYIALLNTLIHELGHAVVTTLTGGKVDKIQLFANAEGKAWSRNHWFGALLTTAAGYPAASATAFLLLYLIHQANYLLVMIIFTGILLISFLLWIRNIYGFLWVISFGALFSTLYFTNNEFLIPHVCIILTVIILVESVTTALDVLILSIRTPKQAGDASGMARATFIIPAPVWGVLFFAQSLVFAWFGVQLYV